jgi:hypothetical protein
MATQTKSNGAVDDVTEKLLGYNEKAIETGKKLTGTYIDSYEKAALGVAELQEKVAAATTVEWVATAASAQAGLTRELTKAYTSAARELVK